MDYSVCLAAAADGPALAQLRWEFRTADGQELPAVTREQFAAAYLDYFHQGRQDGSRSHWIARSGAKILGHLLVQKVPMPPRPCKVQDAWGYVTDHYVRPSSRGQGIGLALLQHALAWARAQDFELLIVWPSESTVGHYRRVGFAAETDILELRLRAYYDPRWSATAPER